MSIYGMQNMEFIFWPEIFDSVHLLTKALNMKGFKLCETTHFYNLFDAKTLHYPSLVLKFVNEESIFDIYNINPQGNYSYVSTYNEGDF
jgi:hypothetical protein